MPKDSQFQSEKRGPVEKTEKGWPINPVGVVALIIFGLVVIFLIARPIFKQKTTILQQDQQQNSAGGTIISPKAGEIIRAKNLKISLFVDKPQNVDKVDFWAKTYADGKWQMIGEIKISPFDLNWQIGADFENKAIALTSHIYQKDGTIIKDPGGWREGIIILSDK